MNDPTGLVSMAAAALGVSPSTLLLLIGAVYLAALATSRLIPDTATGALGTVRTVAGIISVDISSRIAPGITIASVAKAAAATPPVSDTVQAVTGAPIPSSPKE